MYFAGAGFGAASSSSEEGLSGGRDEEALGGMLKEEASKEKLGFGRHWETSVGAESGKRGKREEELEGSCPPPAAVADVAFDVDVAVDLSIFLISAYPVI